MNLRAATASHPPSLLLALAALALVACGGGDPPTVAPDASSDAPLDTPLDTPLDKDAGPDSVEDADAGASACDPDASPLDPVGTDDVAYTSHTTYACLGDKDRLCRASPLRKTLEGLLRCDAIEGGYVWAQGSFAFRVLGREGGACRVEILHETEGGGVIERCDLPLPVRAWAGLSQALVGDAVDRPLEGIESRCTRIGTCNLQLGAPDECWNRDPRPPLCEDFAVRGGSPDP